MLPLIFEAFKNQLLGRLAVLGRAEAMNASGDRSLQQALLLPMNEVDLKWPPAVSGESSMPSHNGDGSRVNNNSTDENKLSVMEFTSTAEVAPTRTTVPQFVVEVAKVLFCRRRCKNFLQSEVCCDCVSPAIPSPPDSPVKTDSLPHINVGNEYQAVIPPMDLSTDDRPEDRETLVFDPKCLENVTDAELNALLKLANSPAVLGGGLNSELAWHLLYDCGGNVKEAALRLLNSENPFPEGHPLHSCNYPDVHMWSPEEIETFETALLKFDKDFNEISKKVKTKSVQQCISFYYSWKTLFKKSYRKYRRTKQQREYLELGMKRSLRSCSPTATEQNSNSNSTTSSVAMATIAEATNSGTGTAIDNAMGTSPTVSETVIAPTLSVTAMEVEQQQQQPHCSNSSNGAVTTTAAAAAGSADIYVSPMHFSCKFCGKVFSKVKSRNAHMKVHYRDLREHPPSTS
ncbi:Transcriptional-regulating factor 1 [Trichinella pseudospiralis]|uniref:Transcriptional-regulating factor 1 n=1 Tax=Trichinella pseudospiralis TaxID=6337 RepID=A0A0V0XT96_TRIPS|nr:Transcriptional-regulating factor 1 [Trichinella pseudospiralis]